MLLPRLVLTSTSSAHFHHFAHHTWPDPLQVLTTVLYPTRPRTRAHPLHSHPPLHHSIRIPLFHHPGFTLLHHTPYLRLDRLLFNLEIRGLGVDCAINVQVVALSLLCSLRRRLAQCVEVSGDSFR